MVDRTSGLKSTINELFKAYNVYDVSDRVIERYEAPFDAKNGQDCIKTTIEYDGGSRRVTKQQEEVAQWDSSWDI